MPVSGVRSGCLVRRKGAFSVRERMAMCPASGRAGMPVVTASATAFSGMTGAQRGAHQRFRW